MKRILYIIISMLPLGMAAQSMYDIVPLFDRGTTGTARFVAMGGSMGALGADVSLMGINPAGIALYRKNDMNLTGSFNIATNKSRYNSMLTKNDLVSVDLDNVGFVLTNKLEDDFSLNVGVNYKGYKDAKRNFGMGGYEDFFSQQYVMRDLYDNCPFDLNNMSYTMYEGLTYNWLSLLAADAWLGDDQGNFLTDKDGCVVWQPTSLEYYSEERGGVDAVDVNVAANIDDVFYFGLTLGFENVDYDRYSCYTESDDYGYIYYLENGYRLQATGFNLKFGAIWRPFRYSPFRVGLALHTPTWYEFTEHRWAAIDAFDDCHYDTRDEELFYDELCVTYKARSPWRLVASAAYTFGSTLALNAEYELVDYSFAEYSSNYGTEKTQNYELDMNLQAQHIFRVGAELSLDDITLRAGYNYATAPFKKGAYKDMMNASVADTSTEYMNTLESQTATLGLGFKYKDIYFDIAYALRAQKADFYPFYDTDYVNPPAKVDFLNHSVMATVGIRL